MARGSRTPTEIKRMQGSINSTRDKNKLELRGIESIPEAPMTLNERAQTYWFSSLAVLQKLGLVTVLDLPLLEVYCIEMANYHELNEMLKGNLKGLKSDDYRESIKALLSAKRDALMQAYKIASQFGFTPVSRSKLPSVDNQKDDIFTLVLK